MKSAKNYFNVINKPLLVGDDSTKVVSVVNFPELHVLTGILGKLVKEMEHILESSESGVSVLSDWMESVNVAKTVYHGSCSFVGDMAKRFLKNLDSLSSTVESYLDCETRDKILPFIRALAKLNIVREMCFGQTLKDGYKEAVEDFSITYRGLNISFPLKVHLVEAHLVEYLELKGGVKGAGFWSEQAMESCHRDFNKEWENNKTLETDPMYGQKLLTSVVRYNGKHI